MSFYNPVWSRDIDLPDLVIGAWHRIGYTWNTASNVLDDGNGLEPKKAYTHS